MTVSTAHLVLNSATNIVFWETVYTHTAIIWWKNTVSHVSIVLFNYKTTVFIHDQQPHRLRFMHYYIAFNYTDLRSDQLQKHQQIEHDKQLLSHHWLQTAHRNLHTPLHTFHTTLIFGQRVFCIFNFHIRPIYIDRLTNLHTSYIST